MQKRYSHILLLATALLCAVSYGQHIASPNVTPVAPGVAYVQFAGAKLFDVTKVTGTRTGNTEVDAYFDAIGVTKISPFAPNLNLDATSRAKGLHRIFTLEFTTPEMTTRQAVDGLLRLKAVKAASPRFIFSQSYMPNDAHIGFQYALTKMNVPGAWDSTHGDPNVVIAVLDDGFNYNHEDLAANIATNPGEIGLDSVGNDKRSNNKDDDGDDYIDNWRGWDFIGKGNAGNANSWVGDNDPIPPIAGKSHGTHVAGCAAAVTDNGKGIAGTGFHCKIMPVKTGDSKNELAAGYEGIEYAARHGARVINCAWGGLIDSQYVHFAQQIIDIATAHAALVVASAGNYASDNDITPYHPANLDGVLSVGFTDPNDKASPDSDYGNTVDVFAPGMSIVTTGVPANDSYEPEFTGTSASAPLAAGVCGLLFAKYPEWTPKFVLRQLVETCDNVVNPDNRTKYWGRVNAGNAVSQPSYPGLIIKGYSIDDVPDASLEYYNKKYKLKIIFKNVVTEGSDIRATLLENVGYKVNLATADLGTMATGKETEASFEFTRDNTDDGEFLRLSLDVTSGTKYKDTLHLAIPISGSTEWTGGAVDSRIEGITFGECYPNPATESVTLPLTLSHAEEIAIDITDILGRSVYSRSEELYDAGSHRLNIDTRKFSKGMYYFTLTLGNGKRFSGQFVTVK